MSAENKPLVTADGGVFAPQYYNPAADQYEHVHGEDGGHNVNVLKSALPAGASSEAMQVAQLAQLEALVGTLMAGVRLDGGHTQVSGFGSFHYAAPFDNLVIIPDVSTTISSGQSSDPSLPVKVIDFKRIGIYADLKDASDVKLIFEASPSGIGDEWYLLEEKEFNGISDPMQYFLLAGGDDILANYVRVTVENTGASPITMPFIRAVVRG